MTLDQRHQLSVHESSHVIVAHRLQWRVTRAGVHRRPTPGPDGTLWHGRTELRWPVSFKRLAASSRVRIFTAMQREHLTILAAGEVGERLLTRRRPIGADADRDLAQDIVAVIAPNEQRQVLHAAKAGAREILSNAWPLVLQVADAMAAAPGLRPWRELAPLIEQHDAERARAYAEHLPSHGIPDTDDAAIVVEERRRRDRGVSRRDIAEAALQIVSARIANGQDELNGEMARALECVALARGLSLQLAASRLIAIIDRYTKKYNPRVFGSFRGPKHMRGGQRSAFLEIENP